MNQLIKITANEQGLKAVSARELYDFLEVKTDFTLWCKRMFEYGFDENEDYSLLKIGERSYHNKIDYALSLDTAKEIAMLQKTDKGKQARQYFIECEKQLSKPKELSKKEILLLALESEERALIAESRILELQPKADFYDAVTESEDTIDLGTAAKVLNLGYGRTTLFSKLRAAKVLMSKNQPYQKYIDEGLFRVIETKFSKPDGTIHVYIKTLVLQKGLDFIRRKLSA